MILVALLSHRHNIPEITVAIFFLPPLKLTVTTIRGSSVLIDKNNHLIKPWLICHGAIMLFLVCLYIISHYVIQPLYLLMFSRLSLFTSGTIPGLGGIITRVNSIGVAAIIAALHGILELDIFDFLQFLAQSGLLGNYIYHFILLLESFQIFLPFLFRRFYCSTASSLLTRVTTSPSLMYCWSERLPKQF